MSSSPRIITSDLGRYCLWCNRHTRFVETMTWRNSAFCCGNHFKLYNDVHNPKVNH